MKSVREAWGIYEDYSGLASENARKLAFGIAAVGWFFKLPNATFPVWVSLSLALLVLYFFCDLSQYVIAAHIRRAYILKKEKDTGKDGLVDEDAQIVWPPDLDEKTLIFWRAKMVLLTLSSLFLLCQFVSRLVF